MSKKKICGVGINDSTSHIILFEKVNGKRKVKWKCPYYDRWFNMIHRCYNPKYKNGYYGKTFVSEKWLLFSNFKSWMEQQDWEGKELDKDILGDGTLYSPENCCFVPSEVNSIIIEERKNNTSGIPNIRRKRDLFCRQVKDAIKNKIIYKSFEKLDDAINFVSDLKLAFVCRFDIEEHIKNALINRYETYRDFYLTDKENDLRKSEIGCPGRRLAATPIKLSVGDRLITKMGFQCEIISINGYDNIVIEFDNGKQKRTSSTSIERGHIKYLR